MEAEPIWRRLWESLVRRLPEPVASLPEWLLLAIVLGLAALGVIVVLMVLLFVLRIVFGRRSKGAGKGPNLEEQLGSYPAIKPSTGDRRLQIEGVPVRLRFVAIAPAGTESDVNEDGIEQLLEGIVPGLGEIFKTDKPRVRIWPRQNSYEGFATHFHRNMITPEKDGELSQWILIAGRAKVGKNQVLIGLALQALKPTTVGRLRIEAHEWDSKLRVRVRE